MKVFYAHCILLDGTEQEKRDVKTLEALGFEVVNPGHPDVVKETARICEAGDKAIKEADGNGALGYGLKTGAELATEYVVSLLKSCDAVAFRAFPDGSIPAQVGQTIAKAKAEGKPVIELPSGISRRILTGEQTKEYLREAGQK